MADDNGIESLASKRVGGQPIIVWGGIAAAGILAYTWYRNRRSTATVTQSIPVPVDTTSGTSVNGVTPTAGTDLPTGAPTDTQSWLTDALAAVRGKGEDPIHALNALNTFLSGGPLSYQDQQVVNAALSAYGAPPGFSAGSTIGTLAPSPGELSQSAQLAHEKASVKDLQALIHRMVTGRTADKKEIAKLKSEVKRVPTVHKPTPIPVEPKSAPRGVPHSSPQQLYTIKSGDTLWNIAQHYYGSGAEWSRIYAANKSTIGSNPNLIHPKTRLVIPK